MHMWAAWAAKEAAVATGLGGGVVPALGARSLDGFAVGALMTGACFLALTGSRRSRRSQRHVLAGGAVGQEMPAAAAGRIPAARHSAGAPAETAQDHPTAQTAPVNPLARTSGPALAGTAHEEPPAHTVHEHPLSQSALRHPLTQTNMAYALGDAVSEVVVPVQSTEPWPVAGLRAKGQPGCYPVAGMRQDGPLDSSRLQPGARDNGQFGTYRSRHRRADDSLAVRAEDSLAVQAPEPRRGVPRHAAPVGSLGCRMPGPAGSLGSRMTGVFPVRPLSGSARN